MASASASQLVLFIASLVVAATVASTLTASVVDVDQSLKGTGLAAADKIETNIDIVSDPGSGAVYNASTGTVTLLVKNTGQTDLDAQASQIDVLVDGGYATISSVSTPEQSASPAWDRGEIVRLRVNRTLAPGKHDLTVHVTGDEETLTIYV